MTDTQARIEELEKHLKSTQEQLDELKKKLEAEKKPKLRHGDYGFRKDTGCEWVVLKRNKTLELFGEFAGAGIAVEKLKDIDSDAVHTGNIFDDLKAMQEDVEEFEVEESVDNEAIQVRISGHNIEMSCEAEPHLEPWFINISQLSQLILKLCQMEVTLKRREEKND